MDDNHIVTTRQIKSKISFKDLAAALTGGPARQQADFLNAYARELIKICVSPPQLQDFLVALEEYLDQETLMIFAGILQKFEEREREDNEEE